MGRLHERRERPIASRCRRHLIRIDVNPSARHIKSEKVLDNGNANRGHWTEFSKLTPIKAFAVVSHQT
jgi:hypothetical protein